MSYAIVNRGHGYRSRWVITIDLTADEAEALGYAFGWHDAGGRELIEAAEELRNRTDPDHDEEP